MDEQRQSPEAEVSRAMEQVLAAERAVGEAVEAATLSAEEKKRQATEAAQRILERADRRISSAHRRIQVVLREEIARLQAEASLTVDHYPELSPDEEQLARLARAAAQWLTADERG